MPKAIQRIIGPLLGKGTSERCNFFPTGTAHLKSFSEISLIPSLSSCKIFSSFVESAFSKSKTLCLKIPTHMRSEAELVIHGIATRPCKIVIYYMTVIYINKNIIHNMWQSHARQWKLARWFLFSFLMSQLNKKRKKK